MTTTEKRARAAMRAIAGTVQGAPPLRLTSAARPGNQGWPGSRVRHLRWSVLAPVAAAVTIVAVAIALVVARNSPGGAAVPPPPASSASPASVPTYTTTAGVPEYYVAWMQADTPYLIIGSTLTGQVRATVKAPDNVYLDAVYGTAGSDSTFIVTGQLVHGPDPGTIWYLLRIAPGSRDPARWTPLQVPGSRTRPGPPSPPTAPSSPSPCRAARRRCGSTRSRPGRCCVLVGSVR